jgi:hypothetical protein
LPSVVAWSNGAGPSARPVTIAVPGTGEQARSAGSAPEPAVPDGLTGAPDGPPAGDVGAIISGVARQIGSTVKPEAAAAIATTFGFPLVLMVAVLLFLLGQSRLDGRDPKLRAAPLTAAESVLPFRDEEAL